jgi:uncharacterized glyoxalase superfamily protein PhnB
MNTPTASNPTSSSTLPPLTRTVWPCVNYRDAHAALTFLADAFGFVPTLVVDGGPARPVAHAEMRWPEGGGIMLGSAVSDGNAFEQRPTGAISIYVVTEQPDALFARATAAGATVVRGLEDTDYGSRGFTVSDPEGNLWSFGTYLGS